MNIVLTDPQDALCSWLCERITYVPTPNMVVFGQYNVAKKRIIGAVGYDNWAINSVEMHCAGEGRWVTRELIYKSFQYPFIRGGVKVVIARVGGDNAKALKFNTHMGFKEQCRIPNAWDGDTDLVILAMQKTDCKWLDLAAMHKKAA